MDYSKTVLNEFVNQLDITQRGVQRMRAWYIFSDRRPGTVVERFQQDAQNFWEYENMFKGGVK